MTIGGDGVPEQKGCNSPKAKINEEQLSQIIYELKNCPYKTLSEIGKEFNITPDIVCNINYGHNYFKNDIKYPIRNHIRGWNINNSKLELDDIFQIKDLLKNSFYTQKEIADMFNVEAYIIADINLGKSFKEQGEVYPIRDENLSKEICFSNFLNPEKINDIIQDLKNEKITMKEIANKYDISMNMVRKINTGKSFCNPKNINYPIRDNLTSYQIGGFSVRKFSEEEYLKIVEDLNQDKLSINQIAEKYNVSRDSISDINNGHTYYHDNFEYPIRKLKYISKRLLNEEQIIKIYEMLKDKNYTIKEISDKFSVSDSVIHDINNGRTYRKDNIEYPIRTFDASKHNRKLNDT